MIVQFEDVSIPVLSHRINDCNQEKVNNGAQSVPNNKLAKPFRETENILLT